MLNKQEEIAQEQLNESRYHNREENKHNSINDEVDDSVSQGFGNSRDGGMNKSMMSTASFANRID